MIEETKEEIIKKIERKKKKITNELYADVDDRIRKGLDDFEDRIYNQAVDDILNLIKGRA